MKSYTSIDNPFTHSNLINSYSRTGTRVSMIMMTILDIIHERKPFVQNSTSCSTLYVLVIYQIHVLYSTLKPIAVLKQTAWRRLSQIHFHIRWVFWFVQLKKEIKTGRKTVFTETIVLLVYHQSMQIAWDIDRSVPVLAKMIQLSRNRNNYCILRIKCLVYSHTNFVMY